MAQNKKYLIKENNNLDKIDITSVLKLVIKKICNIYVDEYKENWFEIDNIKDYKYLKIF